MPLFRQTYRVLTMSGGKRLQAVLVEAKDAPDAERAAIESIAALQTGLSVELVGSPELVPLPHHYEVGPAPKV